MKATVIHVPGSGFIAKSDSNHALPIDWSEKSGGGGSASSPVELVLMALGSCMAIDVVSILEKAKTPADAFRVELTAERAEAHPRVFTRIHLEIVARGKGIKPAALEHAIELSEEKYCSVSAMLGDVARITTSSRIES